MLKTVRLGIATKIFVGFSVILLGVALLALLSVREIRAAAEDLRAIRDGHLALARIVAQLETHQQNRLRDLRRAVEEPDARSRAVILRIAVAYYPGVIDGAIEALAHACAQLAPAHGNGGRGGTRGEHDRQFCEGLLARAQPVREASIELDGLARELFQAARAGQALSPFAARLASGGEALRTAVFELDRFLRAETDQAVTRAEADERHAVWRVLASTLSALVLGIVVTALAARALAPIRPLVRYARAVARGDYHQPLEVGGEGELAALADELRRMAKARDDREEALDRQAKELEKAYLRVAELKRYHESIVRSLRTGVVVSDRTGAVTSANRAARQRWGLDDVAGRPLAELPLGRALASRFGPLDALLAAGVTESGEAVPIEGRLADVTLAPLESEGGEVLGLVVALEDVTEAVRTKEALLRSERLAAIGRMSAHVTHELRNPLASISLNAELLEELAAGRDGVVTRADAEEARQLSRAIGREADRLNALAEEYLRFARLPAPELVPTSPAALLRPLAAFIERDCRAARVELALDVEEDLPLVAIDADQLRQALLNLLRNGKESMPEGGKLTLGARAVGDVVEIFVRDEGTGIPEDAQDRIFDPFYSTKLTGTGLGLALTQQIVQEHGARLEVTSRPQEGSQFSVWLEPARAQPPSPAAGAAETSAEEEGWVAARSSASAPVQAIPAESGRAS